MRTLRPLLRGSAGALLGCCVAATAFADTPATAMPESRAGSAARELLGSWVGSLGDVAGANGLLIAAGVASGGDLFALLDRNRFTRGYPSTVIHGVARLVSAAGTTALEGLRGEDVERWPEAEATYSSAAPGYGRLDTALSGLAALRMAFSDLFLGTGTAFAIALRKDELATALAERRRTDARRLLGPPPLPTAARPRDAR